jgi:5,5'-dehydrodivanillate O-demethylase
VVKKRGYADDGEGFVQMGHPAVFPNMLRHGDGRGLQNMLDGTAPIDMQFRVPIDDTRTLIYFVDFVPFQDSHMPPNTSDPPFEYMMLKNEEGDFHREIFPSQDEMAWETQGPVANREKERLGASDAGIVMWRQLLKQQIEVVQSGGDPMATVRDPERNQMIELGPSRTWDGEQWLPRPWAGWQPYEVWKSPDTSSSAQRAAAG